MEQRHAEAVFRTGFEQAHADLNYDRWPDDWTRRKGRGYPLYVGIAITEDTRPRPTGSRCLQVDLDGGSAEAFSPRIPVSASCSYLFEGYLRTRDLKYNTASFSVTYYDRQGRKQQTFTSPEYQDLPDWTPVRIGPMVPQRENAAFAMIGLHVLAHDRADLDGVAQFDDLQLTRLPRMGAVTNGDFNIFDDPDDVRVTCTMSGMPFPDSRVHFELLAADGMRLAEQQVSLSDSGLSQPTAWPALFETAPGQAAGINPDDGFAGQATWKPPIPGCGFFRVRMTAVGDGGGLLTRVISLAVLDRPEGLTAGEFGWLLPNGDDPLAVDQLSSLLELAGIGPGKSVAAYEAGDARSARTVTLKPLGKTSYDTETRTHDLVLRMLEAKMDDCDAVLISDPLDAEYGLMNQEGTPGELLLPWIVTARLLDGAQYLGTQVLPCASHNRVFVRDGQAIMAVWSDKPTREVLYLGDNVQVVDLWGRTTPAAHVEVEGILKQQVQVGRLPVFVTGLNLAVAQWRLGLVLDNTRLASLGARPQMATIRFQNTFPRGLRGTVALDVPEAWDVSYRRAHFTLAAGELREASFEIALQPVAVSGVQLVRLDFDVTADRSYRFSVLRQMQVGLGDVVIQLETWLDDDGRLIVLQHVSNHSREPLSLDCTLFVPGRRRHCLRVHELGNMEVTDMYALPDGRPLLGKTLWLRAEERDGPRVLNVQVVAQP
jgi:hypothetical protein